MRVCSDREHVMTEQPSTDPLPLLSDHLARHVAAIGVGVVAVHGRHGPPFSGFVWRRGAIVTAEEALEADEDRVFSRSGRCRTRTSGRRWLEQPNTQKGLSDVL